MNRKNTFIIVLILIVLASLACLFNCSGTSSRICLKEGEEYCTTKDWINVVDWDPCYRRGISCMEGECWQRAIEEFEQAIDFLDQDMRDARPYGMHFRDYFPHREMGICFFHLGDIEKALDQLQLSMDQAPSARAKYYLNQARRVNLLDTGQDLQPPTIHLEFSEEESLTNQTPFQLKGVARDDQYVASIAVNQDPLFIELAEPSIHFNHPVHLHEGWNIIKVLVTDLADRKTEEVIRLYLDQQGPTVIIQSIHRDRAGEMDQIYLSGFVHDQSGLASFELNGKEILTAAVDKVFFIEQKLPLPSDLESIPFKAQDLLGNTTLSEFTFSSGRRRLAEHPPRLASNDYGMENIFAALQAPEILIDITSPKKGETETYYREIFLEGRIESRNGIKMVKLNDLVLLDMEEILAGEQEHKEILPYNEKRINRMHEVVQRHNIYYLNRRVPIHKEVTELKLLVMDHLDKTDEEDFIIKKVPRSRVFESEQQMSLAVMPFDLIGEDAYDPELTNYIDKTIVKSFKLQERFDLTAQGKLPWPLINKACQNKQTCGNHLVRQISKKAGADGVICGHIKKWLSGVEIKAEFRDPEEGNNRLSHDVFTPQDTPQDLNAAIFGLAIKFRDDFPICTGQVIAREGNIIYVDIGTQESVFSGMSYNIFKDEKKLITKAGVRDVTYRESEAKITERKKSHKVERGDYIRTR